ncbi:SixA phosphatase family protein [Rasiella sp. SM2506]|uniref:SixA phosphatase family protein n=1 Tax=Rasiella sp. SM2506 TaxID=3423914 RepID=UPI003D7BB1DD
MRYLLLFITLVFISCGTDKKEEKPVEESTLTTYYLIRHAEKDRNIADNPGLMAIGKERATHWANFFKDIPLEAVYSTDYNRTKETAAPIAKNKSLTVLLYNPDKLYDTEFQEATKGKNVLIVGHSNTTPSLVNTILGENKYPPISDTENAMLYKVVVSEKGETSVIIEKVEME